MGVTRGSGWGRRASQVDDLGTAGACDPDLPVVLPTVQVTAALVLSGKGHEGSTSGIGRGDYHSVDAMGYYSLDNIS